MDRKFDFLTKIESSPGSLMKGLLLIQSAHGYISDAGIRAAAEYFCRPAAEVEDVVRFYPQFRRVRPGKFRLAVCDGTVCRRKGASQLHAWLRQELGIAPGETTGDGCFSLETVPCLGNCREAPVLRINGRICAGLDRSRLKRILTECRNSARKTAEAGEKD